MKKPLIAGLSILCAAAVTPAIADISSMEPKIFSVKQDLPTAKSPFKCVDYAKIKSTATAAGDSMAFYEPENIDKKTPSFVVFDKKTWILSVCDKGQIVHGKIEHKDGEDFTVDVGNSILMDLNENGKTDLLVGFVQCAEGPCFGSFFLLEVDGGRLRKNWRIDTTVVDVISKSGQNFLKLTDQCFTHEFGSAVSWFSIAGFDKNGDLIQIPMKEIKKRFPDQVNEYIELAKQQDQNTTGLKNKNPARAYAEIFNLLARAYKGEGSKDLLPELTRISKPFSKSGGLPVHCDFKDVLKRLDSNGA